MWIHAIAGTLSFSIFSLGLFLGAGVRPLLMPAMKSEPALIGPVLTGMFSRYNLVALGLSIVSLIIEMTSAPSLTKVSVSASLTLILALKIAFDRVIKRRERSAQVRGIGEEGKRLNLLHQIVERATLVVIMLSFSLFVLNLLAVGKP
ncbi:hypothetical protein [Granulicella arctica]|uniref:hypothetical protein n=1 Tax=Granulicella arctica TaxID=940613 RepID=UPI0021DFE972|nr:hypothetical protein [Granulicella arctica]